MNENVLSPVENQETTATQPQDCVKQDINVEQPQIVEGTPSENDIVDDATEEAKVDAMEEEIEAIDCEPLSREELIEKLSELMQNDDIEAIKSNVAAIKVAFHEKTRAEAAKSVQFEPAEKEENTELPAEEQEQPVKEKVTDTLETKFNEVFSIYKTKRAKFLEQLEEQKKVNLADKQQILDKLKELVNSEETLKTTYDEFRNLQEKWKEIGAVPKTEVNNLWQNYHFLVEKFFDKVKINRELRDLDIKKNLEAKIALCEKAEELLLEPSMKKAFTKVQEYRQEWKVIGPVPSDKRDELWERFRTAVDKIGIQRKEHYQELKERQDANYAAKLALLEQADKLLENTPENLKDWQTVGDQLNELFKMWKSIGPAAKAQNDEIWGRFKPKLDNFFMAKKEFFNQLKGQLVNNYNLKLDLCTQAEAVKDSEDWAATTQTLIALQKEWKTIGPTPKKVSDKIWKRFRGACDEFFTKKENFYSTINEANEENLKKKLEIIEKIKNLDINETNLQTNLSDLKQYQRDWMEIGHVPKKDKDTVQNDFRNVVNEQLDKLKSIGADVSNYNFKSKIDQLKEGPNSSSKINVERNKLYTRIQQMKEDVALWENNIGFLANSKNSNILKDEFEKKIQRTKQEIALLEAKMKYINEDK